jgi:hypothetical protein
MNVEMKPKTNKIEITDNIVELFLLLHKIDQRLRKEAYEKRKRKN